MTALLRLHYHNSKFQEALSSLKNKMKNEIKKLKEFRKWFAQFIKKKYGKKCSNFTWNCPVCHAYFVKEILIDFIEDFIKTESWSKKQMVKSKIVEYKL